MDTDQTCSEFEDDGSPCPRKVFTAKSGLCQRHYDRDRTARLAAERPPVVMVRDQKCHVCGEMGYRKWEGEPKDSVVCKRHWDMWRRRGTFDEAESPTGTTPMCEAPGCNNRAPYREFGIFCQNHHRMVKRRGGSDLSIELPKGPPRTGETDHRKKEAEQIAADLAARRASRIGGKCGSGRHVLAGDNLREKPDGSLACRECEHENRTNYERSERGKQVREQRRAHDAEIKQTREFYHLHGMTREQYDARLLAQGYNCASCGDPLNLTLGAKGVCTDHDHTCCPGPQSCGKCIRGLLCPSCNVGNGFFKDDPVRMVKNAIYVMKYRKATDAEYESLAEMLLYDDSDGS